MLYGLLILLACHVVVQSVLLGVIVPNMTVMPSPFPTNLHVGTCLASTPPLFSFFWCVLYPTVWTLISKYCVARLPEIPVETILFSFVAIKAIQAKPWILRKGHNIMTVLLRDGTVVFICMFGEDCRASANIAD